MPEEIVNIMIKSHQITSSSIYPCLKIWKEFGRYITIAERVSYFLYSISKEFPDDLNLKQNAAEEYLDILMILFDKFSKRIETLNQAQYIATQTIKIIEYTTEYSIDSIRLKYLIRNAIFKIVLAKSLFGGAFGVGLGRT